MDDLVWGGNVRTREGVEGTLVKVGFNETLHISSPSPVGRGNRGDEVYAVVLSTGEVRFFLADALIPIA